MNAAELQLMVDTRAKVEHMEKGMSDKIEELKAEVDRLNTRVEKLCQSVTSYMEKTPDQIVSRIEDLIDDAFPNDPEVPDATPSEKRKLHRRYHAKLIAEAVELAKAKHDITEKMWLFVLEKGVTIAALALAAYFGLKVPGGG
mgnify:CR=1 FL=1